MLPRLLHAANLTMRSCIRSIEEWWFDAARGVQTSGNVRFRDAGPLAGDVRDGVNYIPARVANARAALRALPVRDLSSYTFVDLGSGKGRMLFVAADHPFRRIVGVEFSTKLHDQALQNIARYKHRNQQCFAIESVLANALHYEFPDGNLVLYLFNPFGQDTMRRVLANLDRSLQDSPRHVIVLLLWPENGALLAQMCAMRLYRVTRRYQIYESCPSPGPSEGVAQQPQIDLYSSAPCLLSQTNSST